MNDTIYILGELRERLSDLKSIHTTDHWVSFLASITDRMSEIQANVNNLDVTGAKLEEYRVTLKVLTEIANGTMTRGFIAELETRVSVIEHQDAEDREKMEVASRE